MNPTPEPELPEVPNFDDRAIRRAITRGVFRTALVALIWFLLLSLFGQLLSAGLQEGFGRRERFLRVAATGFVVAHPEYRFGGGGCCNTTLLTMKVDVTLSPRIPSSDPPEIDVWVAQNALGHLDPASVSVPQTDLGMFAAGGPLPRSTAERVMAQLPEGMRASAVIAFRQPLDDATVAAFLQRWGSGVPFVGAGSSLILSWAPRGQAISSPWLQGPVGWQADNPAQPFSQSVIPTIDGFRRWVDSLSAADDETLAILGLPPVATLRQLADQGAVGIVVSDAPVRVLQQMLDDPDVRSIGLGAVAFDLGQR
ncbi:MAG: hypothetical protein HY240_07565 [Actinobacteria bacterium]|nr:hypothetical protein [Actinomycetota bacterium]